MIAVAGSNDPVSVSINRLSGRFLNRCGQKPCRFFLRARFSVVSSAHSRVAVPPGVYLSTQVDSGNLLARMPQVHPDREPRLAVKLPLRRCQCL